MNANQILLNFANQETEQELPGVYFLCGNKARRITALSQQHRAISLVEALVRNGKINQGTRVGIVGGGIAGCTAAYWAVCNGANVTVHEKGAQALQVYEKAHHRMLHPSLFNWPAPGWDCNRTHLPCMNWDFGTAQSVGRSLASKLQALQRDVGDQLSVVANARVHLQQEPHGAVRLVRANGMASEFEIIILSVGYGGYGTQGQGYWDGEADELFFGRLKCQQTKQVVVVGNGDGGVMDVLRIKTTLQDEAALVTLLRRWREEFPESYSAVEQLVQQAMEGGAMVGLRDIMETGAFANALGKGGKQLFAQIIAGREPWQAGIRVQWHSNNPQFHPGVAPVLAVMLAGLMEVDPGAFDFTQGKWTAPAAGLPPGTEALLRFNDGAEPLGELDQRADNRRPNPSNPKTLQLAGVLQRLAEADFFSAWYFFPDRKTPDARKIQTQSRPSAEDILRKLKEASIARCNSVAVPVFKASGGHREGISSDAGSELLRVYTGLRVRRWREASADDPKRGIGPKEYQPEGEEQEFLEALRSGRDQRRHSVLMGEGGRGKSTITNFVTRALWMDEQDLVDAESNASAKVRRDIQKCRETWKDFLPVLVRVRDLARYPLDRMPDREMLVLVELFRLYMDCDVPSRASGKAGIERVVFETFREDIGGLLKDKAILLILDGMDEIDVKRRATLVLAAAAPKNSSRPWSPADILITARRATVLHDSSRVYRTQLKDWPLHEVLPLSDAPGPHGSSQQFEFAMNYLGADHAEAAKMAHDLLLAVKSRGLEELAGEPLLLAALARLYLRAQKTAGDPSLPTTKVEVLDASINLLIEEWDSTKGLAFSVLDVSTRQELGPNVPRQALGELAYSGLFSSSDEATAFQFDMHGLESSLQRLCEAVPTSDPRIDAIQLARAFSDRVGILRRIDGGEDARVDFSVPQYACLLAGLFWMGDANRFLSGLEQLGRSKAVLWEHVRSAVRLGMAGMEYWLDKPKPERSDPSPKRVWALLAALANTAVNEAQANEPFGRELLGLVAEAGQEMRMLEREFRDGDVDGLSGVRGPLLGLFGKSSVPGATRAAAGWALAWVGESRSTMATLGDRAPSKWSRIIQPRRFDMGSKPGEDASSWEQPRFPCSLVREPFCLGIFPVTTAQFRMFEQEGYTEAALGSYWTREGAEFARRGTDGVPLRGRHEFGQDYDAPNAPVVGVGWHEAVAFCRWVNGTFTSEDLGLPQGWKVRLPTEAEWELAASYRGGKKCVYPWGNDPDVARRANCGDSCIGRPSAVGSFGELGRAECGAEDMIGNVWEWCSTGWTENYQGYQDVPHVRDELVDGGARARQHLETKMRRVVRGGAWHYVPRDCRSACRYRIHPTLRDASVGFRLAASPISEFWSL